jgi:hypothetical protein
MISLDETLGLIDRLDAWLPGALHRSPVDARTYLAAPLVVVVIVAAPRLVLHRVLPWTGRFVLVPAAVLVTGVVTGLVLTLDFLLARLFRLFWLPLTGAHYALGDWAVAGGRSARSHVRHRVSRAGGWLRRFSPGALLLAGVVVTILWEAGYCSRNPGAGCSGPLTRWWHEVWTVWQSLWD